MGNYYVNRILEEKKITTFLEERGIYPAKVSGNKSFYRCPIHPGDNDPSFIVYKEGTRGRNYQTYYCFGCVEENELIWTEKGLIKIKDIIKGDKVLDINGGFSEVKKNKISKKNIYEVKLGCFSDPLLLTSDHTCIYIDKYDAVKYLPYLYNNKEKIVFSNIKKNKKIKKHIEKIKSLKLKEGKLSSLKEGDFFIFPVIDEKKRIDADLINNKISDKYTFGPKKNRIRINGFKSNSNVSFIIGLWLAEGSICSNGRVVRWTFNINEIEIAEKLSDLIWREFSLKSTIYKYPKKNTCELDCYNVDLAGQFVHWFGKGAKNKKIPIEILRWNKNLQLKIIESFVLGDGCKSGRQCYTISKKLAYSLYCLSIQSGRFPYLTPRKERVDKNGIFHASSYCIGFSSKERSNGFYENINKKKYYISKIKKISNCYKKLNVIDIEVDISHSFVTKLGVVHNCHSGINLINLKKDLDSFSSKEVIRFFLKEINIDKEEVRKSIIRDFKNGKLAIEEDKRVEQLLLLINTTCKDHLSSYNDEEEMLFFDTFFQHLDKVAVERDIETLEGIYEILSDKEGLEERAKAFLKRQDEQAISLVAWKI